MDPYEYLLNKFNIIPEFAPEFNTYSLYTKLETGKKFICTHIPIGWTHEQIFKYYRNLDPNRFLRQYDKEIDQFCQLLQQFPNDLESTEHVDLLLTLNGLNNA